VRIEPRSFGGMLFASWAGEEERMILNWRRPNAMELHIMDEPKRKMYLHVYCVPVDHEHTKMMLASARTFFGSRLITWFASRFNNVLGEDRQVVETTDPKEVPHPSEEIAVATDGPPLYFRKYYYRELRESATTLVPTGRIVRKTNGANEAAETAEEASAPTDVAPLGVENAGRVV